jgi:hypothetical protein
MSSVRRVAVKATGDVAAVAKRGICMLANVAALAARKPRREILFMINLLETSCPIHRSEYHGPKPGRRQRR